MCLSPLAGPTHCQYQRCHFPVWLNAPGQAGTPQQARHGQLWLLLTIIYGPLWLKTWELEIEGLVWSQGTTLRYKTEAAAAVRSGTPAKLCRPSAHTDKHKLCILLCFLFLSIFIPSSLGLVSVLLYIVSCVILICYVLIICTGFFIYQFHSVTVNIHFIIKIMQCQKC